MSKFQKGYSSYLVAALCFICVYLGSCSLDLGPDSIFSHEIYSGKQPISGCTTECHNDSISPNPLNTNGQGSEGKHIVHVQERELACEKCHSGYKDNPNHMNKTVDTTDPTVRMVFFDATNPTGQWSGDTGAQTGGCSSLNCHTALDWYGTSSPSCTVCHFAADAVDNPLLTNGQGSAGKHIAHVTDRGLACETCHTGYKSNPTHMNATVDTTDPTVQMVFFDATNPTGQWSGDTGAQTGSCASLSCHNSLAWYASSPSCTDCHLAADAADNPLLTNGQGTAGKHIIHVTDRGLACETCHTGYKSNPTHMNATVDTTNPTVRMVFFDATNPTGQWTGDTGAQTGGCVSLNCHGTDSLDWYTTAAWTPPECVVCHATAQSTRRQVAGSNGDFAANSSILSGHIKGASDPTSSQCQVCHDQSTHTAGTVRLKNADTGSALTYDPAGPATLEPFCLSCHDANGATSTHLGAGSLDPFNDGSTLGTIPNTEGISIAGYWNNSYTVHKDSGLSCAGTGEPSTGCHGNNGKINMHGSVSKGLLTKNLTLPVPSNSAYDYEQYRLCFDCHDSYPNVSKEVVLGYKQGGNYDLSWAPTPFYTAGIQSLFRDRFIPSTPYPDYWGGVDQPYNDNFWWDPYTPLHNYHLSPTDSMMKRDTWNYRGQELGRASCTTCHNVHGTAGTVRSTYQEFGITAFSGQGPDEFKKLVPETNYDDAVLKASPINCAKSCHGMISGTSYWHTPSGE